MQTFESEGFGIHASDTSLAHNPLEGQSVYTN